MVTSKPSNDDGTMQSQLLDLYETCLDLERGTAKGDRAWQKYLAHKNMMLDSGIEPDDLSGY